MPTGEVEICPPNKPSGKKVSATVVLRVKSEKQLKFCGILFLMPDQFKKQFLITRQYGVVCSPLNRNKGYEFMLTLIERIQVK